MTPIHRYNEISDQRSVIFPLRTISIANILIATVVLYSPTVGASVRQENAPIALPFVENSRVSFYSGVEYLHYVEDDPKRNTSNGILNSEKGFLPYFLIHIGYQSRDILQYLALYAAADISYAFGQTNYDGHLIFLGGRLEPYQSTSGIGELTYKITLGAALHPWPIVNLIPYVTWDHRDWFRGLTQYKEYFTHHALLGGLLTQYRPIENIQLGVSFAVGEILYAAIQAPKLGFDSTLGNRFILEVNADVEWLFFDTFSLSLRGEHRYFIYGASPVLDNAQEPESSTSQSRLLIGVTWHY